MLKVPDVGEKIILNSLRLGTGIGNWFCMLYQNNYTPVDASVFADFTEATFNGYVAQSFTFAAATTVATRGKVVANAPCVFTCTGGSPSNTIYGYMIGDTLTGEVVWAERFGSSQFMSNNGDQISITLELTAQSEF